MEPEEIERLRADLARQRHEAAAVASVAHLVSEALDLPGVCDRIAHVALDLLRVHSSAIRLFRADGALAPVALAGRARDYVATGGVVGAGIGLIGRVAIDGRPMWTEDFRVDPRFEYSPEILERNAAAGIVAGLAVPLRVRGNVIGVLSVGAPEPRAFTDAEIALLQTFADQAAVTINNARVQGELAQHAERLRMLHEIDRALIAEQAPVAIAEAALLRLRELLGSPRVIVNLFDFERGDVEWLAAVGRRRLHTGAPVRYPLALAGDLDALRRGEPQVIDVRALAPSAHSDALLASGINVYVVVPMQLGGELIGSVSIGREAAEFTPEHLAIAREVADQMAIAITHARLHERVVQSAADLERRVEERTREVAAANRELDAFTYTVSHDLKAPLRGMEGFARALEEDYAERLDDVGRRYLQMIRGSATRMGHLIDDLLRYSRLDRRAVERRAVALRPLLAQLCEELDGEIRGRGLTVCDDLAVPELVAEKEGIREALANLLSNAVKFSPAEGGVVSVRSYRDGDETVVAVSDNGIGFDMRHHDRIFGIFERLHAPDKYPGTGVGLAIVRKVAERHRGRAWAESEPGRGSTFYLAIPAG